MSLLNDPSMKEVVDEFCDETNLLIDELEDILDSLEEDIEDSTLLETFGQKIDRIMGSAATLGADEIAKFCELGKIIGYKSSQAENLQLREMVVAILFDTIDLLRQMVSSIKTSEQALLKQINTEAFGSRLKWLSDKFKDIDRASVSYKEGQESEKQDQAQIDDIMKSLGLG